MKTVARKVLPQGLHHVIQRVVARADNSRVKRHLARLRREVWEKKPGDLVRFLDYSVHINDGPSFYMQYKDEFIHRIYHFDAARPDPLIIDGGSNVGMSILYFKRAYPQARIIGFEPDPAIYSMLQDNLKRNALRDVTIVNAGLGTRSGSTAFLADGRDGGQFGEGENSITVQVVTLSDYLAEPVDFLKLNIEGEELPVLLEAEASGSLANIREMVLEYHGWPGGQQRLGAILQLLDRQGFRYLVHDFDAETCNTTKPPFTLTPSSTWFCLVYARRTE